MAALAAEGKLRPGDVWRQESITGSVFDGTYRPDPAGPGVIPTVTGTAFVTAESTLILDPADPLRFGTRAEGDR